MKIKIILNIYTPLREQCDASPVFSKEYMLNTLADKTNIQNQFCQHLQSVMLDN